MKKITYSQYSKIIRGKAWERFRKDHPLFDLTSPLVIGLLIGIEESFRIAGRIEPLITALVPAVITVVMYSFLYISYCSREHVFIFNDANERINSYIEKYEAKPIRVNIDLVEWEYAELVGLGVTSIPADPSKLTHTTISMAGIRVINKEKNAELTSVYGSLNSLEVRCYTGHRRIPFEEATRNGSLFSWSGPSNEGEVSIKPGKDRILKIAEGRGRDLIFMLQNLEYRQVDNATYIFEIEIGGKIFDKPIEPHKQKFHVSFEKVDEAFVARDGRTFGPTDNSSKLLADGFVEYDTGSYRKLQIRKVIP